MNNRWVVELEPGVWIAHWTGDPGRTLKIESALFSSSESWAMRELTKARKFRPFPKAEIYAIDQYYERIY